MNLMGLQKVKVVRVRLFYICRSDLDITCSNSTYALRTDMKDALSFEVCKEYALQLNRLYNAKDNHDDSNVYPHSNPMNNPMKGVSSKCFSWFAFKLLSNKPYSLLYPNSSHFSMTYA